MNISDLNKTQLIPNITHQKHLAVADQVNIPSFTDYLKNDVDNFINRAHHNTNQIMEYVTGKEDIEYLAPHLKNTLLEFEEKARVLELVIGSLKNLLNMPL